jgi:hypothetical protein
MRNNQPMLEEPLSTIKSARFWKIPTGEDDLRQGYPPGHIASWCYRDGRFWVQELYGPFQAASGAIFHGVDLKTFSARLVAFKGEQHAFTEAMLIGGKHEFDVDGSYLYLWLKDSVRRYSFKRQNWEVFTPAGDSKPERLGDRLFFTSPTSVRECLPDGALQLLASCRRRPAVTALDNMDNYGACHLFLDAKGRINLCASNELYRLAGANDWQHYATIPARDLFPPTLFDDGFIVPMEEWWGMFGPCQKPEFLFRQPGLPGRHAATPPATPAPRWPAPPPSLTVCPEGDCLWFLVDSSRPMRAAPGISPAGPESTGGLSLVRCQYDEPRSMRMALTLPEPQGGAAQASARGPENLRRRGWMLTTTPEGLVATHREARGFWLIPRADLNQALTEAYARQSAPKARTKGLAPQTATP